MHSSKQNKPNILGGVSGLLWSVVGASVGLVVIATEMTQRKLSSVMRHTMPKK